MMHTSVRWVGLLLLVSPLCLAAEPPPTDAPEEVVLFSTGEAAVRRVREKARGVTTLQFPLPRALDGTVWIESETAIREARAYWGPHEEFVETRGRLDLLRQGIGAPIRIQLDEDGGGSLMEGTLVRLLGDRREAGGIPADDPGVQLVVRGEKASSIMPLGSVAWFDLPTELTEASSYRALVERALLDVRLAASRRDGKTALTYIVRGLSWQPSWSLHLGEEGSDVAQLDGKAVLVNDLEPLHDTRVRLVVGHAPLHTGSAITALWPGARPLVRASSGEPAGGMVRAEMKSMAYESAPGIEADFAASSLPTPAAEQDLHVYDLGQRTLGVGERLYVPILSDRVAVQHRFEWKLYPHVTPQAIFQPPDPDQSPPVQHMLELENEGSGPWTTATLMVYGPSTPLARTVLPYTAAGDHALITLAEARDLRRKATERQLEPKAGKPQTVTRFKNVYEQVQIEGTLELENLGRSDRPIRIERTIRGRLLKADHSPGEQSLIPSTYDINPTRTLSWEFDLPAGEQHRISYVYEVLIRR